MNKKFKSVYIEAFSHSTESVEKVKEAMLNLIPPGMREYWADKISAETVSGQYGNQIVILRLKIGGKSTATPNEIAYFILRESVKQLGLDELSKILDEGLTQSSLYLRVDKQKAFTGTILPSTGDNIIKIELTLANQVNTVQDILKSLEEPNE